MEQLSCSISHIPVNNKDVNPQNMITYTDGYAFAYTYENKYLDVYTIYKGVVFKIQIFLSYINRHIKSHKF